MTNFETPEGVFQHYRAYLARELSKDFTPDQLENWILQLCETLCQNRSLDFGIRLARLVRSASTQALNYKDPQPMGTKGEQMVMQALKFLNLEYIREFRVLSLLDTRPNYQYELGWSFEIHAYCRYDFRITSLGKYYGTLIEYDGGHHFSPVKYTETDTDYIRRFETHQNNDRLKRAIAIGLGYKMIRIHYQSPTSNVSSMAGAIIMALKELETDVSRKCVCVVSESSDGHEYDYLEGPVVGMSVYIDPEVNLGFEALTLQENMSLQQSNLMSHSRPKWLSEIQALATWIDDQQVRTPISNKSAHDPRSRRPNLVEWNPEHQACMHEISKLLKIDVLTDRSTLITEEQIKLHIEKWQQLYPRLQVAFSLRNTYPESFQGAKQVINSVLKSSLGCELKTISKQRLRINNRREWKYTYRIESVLEIDPTLNDCRKKSPTRSTFSPSSN